MRKILSVLFAFYSISIGFAQRPVASVPTSSGSRLSSVAMIDLPGRPGFADIAFANKLIVVSHTGANSLDVFDPQKRRMVAQITNIAQPRGIAVDARNNRIFVATANSVIAVISAQDWEVKDTFTVQGSPDVLALSGDGMRLFVADRMNSAVSAIDTSLRKTIATVQLGGRPESIAVGDANVIYVTVQDEALVVAINAQMQVASRFKLQASQPTGIAYDASSKRLFVAVRSGIMAINADNGSEAGRVPAPRGVDTLYFDQPSHTLYAAGGGSVISVNTAGGLASLDELKADVKGHTLVFDQSRKLIFLPGGREGRSKMLIVRDARAGASQNVADAELKLQ